MTFRFVLASASPARLSSLTAAGVAPEVVVSSVDEQALTEALVGASTAEVAARLAAAKAGDVAAQMDGLALVLGCDSLLDLDGRALGKPDSVEAAVERWRQMRGRTGTLHTGHCLIDVVTGRSITEVAATAVRFAEVTDAEIEAYCNTGEPTRVAGAFTVDGLGGWFVEAIDGDHHNVVGVSLPLVRAMLRELGYSLADVGYPQGG
ncbi:MAG TPA: Maf family protein [Jatrophihabitantaceae bacterium]|jgi:septum formation protein|nr:Maf family protein [Jatrophihabitantaceae bacterium]